MPDRLSWYTELGFRSNPVRGFLLNQGAGFRLLPGTGSTQVSHLSDLPLVRGRFPVEADTQEIQIPRKTLRQIRSDCQNAISDAHLAFADDSPVRLYCVDHAPETLAAYGRQLWYFDGQAINEDGKQSSLFGVLEYRLEYGLHELIERGVFDSVEQRDRFHRVYTHGFLRDPLWNTATLWLGAALIAMTVITSLLILWRLSPA